MLSLRRHITAHVLKVVTRGVATDPLPVAQACIRREVRRRHIHLRNIPCAHPGGKKKGKEKEEKAGSRRKPSPHVLPPLSRATLCRGGGSAAFSQICCHEANRREVCRPERQSQQGEQWWQLFGVPSWFPSHYSPLPPSLPRFCCFIGKKRLGHPKFLSASTLRRCLKNIDNSNYRGLLSLNSHRHELIKANSEFQYSH